ASCRAGLSNSSLATTHTGPRPWAICAGAMEACRACCTPRFWSGRARLEAPPPDGGLWSSRKVAAWMAGELGLAEVLPQRGWEALKAIDWSVQKPRPGDPGAATPEEREAFKKTTAAK